MTTTEPTTTPPVPTPPVPVDHEAPTRYRDALQVGEFRALSGSSLISILGDSAAYLAVTVLMYQRTGSALLSALTFVCAFVPYVFGGTLLAGLVDRVAPRRLLMGCDLFAGALVAVIAVPGVPVGCVFAVLFGVGVVAPVRSGTASALVAEVLPGPAFVAGRSVLRIIAQSAQIAGAAAGGALIAPLGPRGALLADTGSFIASAGLVALFVAARPLAGVMRGASLVGDSLAGIRAVWALPAVRRLVLLSWIVPFVVVSPEALAAPSVAHLGRSAGYVGLWLAAIPVGTVLGDLLAVWLLPPRWLVRLIWPLALAGPVVLLAFGAAPPLGVALALLVVTGAMSAYGLGLDRQLRELTPVELRARMYSLNTTGLMVVQGMGFAAAGALAEVLAPSTVVAIAGLAGVLGVATLRARPRAADQPG